MGLPSAVAVYFLVWVLSAFLVLPFIGARNRREEGDPRVPGQADSAPKRFPMAQTALWTTLLASVLFAIFWLNWEYGWVTVDMLDWTQW
ncbi:MAG: hypothetical protein CMN72_08280 [Sphingomonas sp.]|nr:hypothetical protein [Sphingomonas sp.]|tara:strand:+ start:43 stop:309 length:267 start_codon:yes stop_codon:yes gene_type:complete